MKRRKYTYNIVAIEPKRLGVIFELLTDKELAKRPYKPVTKKVSVYSDKIYYFFGLRYALWDTAKDFSDEIKTHALGVLKRCNVKPENLTPDGRRSLFERVRFDLRGLGADDVDEVINNIVKNL